MAFHVFVIMPFGTKEGINFDAVYRDYIKPALYGEDVDPGTDDDSDSSGSLGSAGPAGSTGSLGSSGSTGS